MISAKKKDSKQTTIKKQNKTGVQKQFITLHDLYSIKLD